MGEPHFKERVRRDVLKRRGLERTGQGHLATEQPKSPPVPPSIPYDSRKTLAMRLLEQQFNMSIEDLLMEPGTLDEVGDRLFISYATVSVWRKRLGLRL